MVAPGRSRSMTTRAGPSVRLLRGPAGPVAREPVMVGLSAAVRPVASERAGSVTSSLLADGGCRSGRWERSGRGVQGRDPYAHGPGLPVRPGEVRDGCRGGVLPHLRPGPQAGEGAAETGRRRRAGRARVGRLARGE